MDNPILWLVWLLGLTILSLVQALVLVLRLNQGRSNRKKNNQKPENPTHGERLVALETEMENLEKDFEKFQKENREDHQKLLDKLNKKG